jgi:hypothetical protein
MGFLLSAFIELALNASMVPANMTPMVFLIENILLLIYGSEQKGSEFKD